MSNLIISAKYEDESNMKTLKAYNWEHPKVQKDSYKVPVAKDGCTSYLKMK